MSRLISYHPENIITLTTTTINGSHFYSIICHWLGWAHCDLHDQQKCINVHKTFEQNKHRAVKPAHKHCEMTHIKACIATWSMHTCRAHMRTHTDTIVNTQ